MSDRLSTKLLGIELKNPVIAASGTFGFGTEYAELFDVGKLGGICSKGLTLAPHTGNMGVRMVETAAGMMNSIGMGNPGIKHFTDVECAKMRSFGCAVIANLGGATEEDYCEGARMLNDADIDILEVNISCPNVKNGCMAFGLYPTAAGAVTEKVKKISRHPIMVKLTPNAIDIEGVALACESAGADAISLVNTFLGMAIDIKKRKPMFENVYAGLSGPAIMPIALRLVHGVCKRVKVPVVGMGGIATVDDALSFIMAGATAVQVGTMTFANPYTMLEIIDGLEKYCVENKLDNIQQICGAVLNG